MALKRLALVSLVALVAAQAAHAQSTNIAPDVAAGVSLGTTVNRSSNTYTIHGGTTSGTNLFHSFTTFDLGAGDIAKWVHSSSDPASITNVINRITGGSPSSILGVLDSTAIPNADFYFINPAGIVFGGDAVVNVPTAAHFSTASELRFADGKVLSVATPSGSTLSVAAPQSFGFLGNEGDIVHDANHYTTFEAFLPGAGELTLSAANLTIQNGFIGAQEMAFTAVGAEAGDVPIDASQATNDYGGSLAIYDSWLQTWPVDCYEDCYANSGRILLNGGSILLSWSGVVAAFDSPANDGVTSSIRVLARDAVTMVDSIVDADGYGAADAGAVVIESGGIVDIIDSFVFSLNGGSGAGGAILIRGNDIHISGGFVTSDASGSGDAGEILIEAAELLHLENGSWVQSLTEGVGNAGAVTLTAPDILITDSLVSSESYGSGNAGTLAVAAGATLTLLNSFVSSSTYAEGAGGSVDVNAGGLLHMEGSSITSNSSVTSSAGDVNVHAGEALLTSGSVISSDGFMDGDAGNVTVAVSGHLQVTGGSRISSSGGQDPEGSSALVLANLQASSDTPQPPAPPMPSPTPEPYVPPPPPPGTAGAGAAGSVSISAGQFTLADSSEVSTLSYGLGHGGSISVTADDVVLDLSSIGSDAFGGGNAGTISISAAQSLTMLNSTVSSSTYNAGDGGSIEMQVGGDLKMLGSGIATDSGSAWYPTNALGDAGSISIIAGDLEMDRSGISSTTIGEGAGGQISIVAGDIVLSSSSIGTDSYGSADAGWISIVGDSLTMTGNPYIGGSSINSLVLYGEGTSGSIEVDIAGHILMDTGSSINTDNQGSGRAGAIRVNAGSLEMRSAGLNSQTYGREDSGSIDVVVEGAIIMESASISTSTGDISGTGTGNAGRISIAADSISLHSSSIASTAANEGQGGQILLTVRDFAATASSQVATNSHGSGAAGDILVDADKFSLTDGSEISSENLGESGGDAGSIVIRSNGVEIRDGARVSTNSLTGAAGDITFDMAPGSILTLSGAQLPGIIETSSGPGTGGVITIASPLAIISHGGVISALGESGGANVQIDANYFIASSDRLNVVEVDGTLAFSNAIYDVSSGTTDADLSIIDASDVLQGQCSTVRATGQASQLNIRPAGPLGAADWPRLQPAAPTAGTAQVGGCQ